MSFSASTAEIRSAFKRLILLSHPDRFASNNQELDFIKIKQAYSILGNEDFRAVYDSQGYQAALLAVEGNTTFSYDMWYVSRSSPYLFSSQTDNYLVMSIKNYIHNFLACVHRGKGKHKSIWHYMHTLNQARRESLIVLLFWSTEELTE